MINASVQRSIEWILSLHSRSEVSKCPSELINLKTLPLQNSDSSTVSFKRRENWHIPLTNLPRIWLSTGAGGSMLVLGCRLSVWLTNCIPIPGPMGKISPAWIASWSYWGFDPSRSSTTKWHWKLMYCTCKTGCKLAVWRKERCTIFTSFYTVKPVWFTEINYFSQVLGTRQYLRKMRTNPNNQPYQIVPNAINIQTDWELWRQITVFSWKINVIIDGR
jgi:hypothetical protein